MKNRLRIYYSEEQKALMMVINLKKQPPGLIHHSDRSSQYASHAYQALLKQHGIIFSMSVNAPVERFFSSLKREWTGDRLYSHRGIVSTALFRYPYYA